MEMRKSCVNLGQIFVFKLTKIVLEVHHAETTESNLLVFWSSSFQIWSCNSSQRWKRNEVHELTGTLEHTSEELEYDLEWLTILHIRKHLMSVQPHRKRVLDLRLKILNFVPTSKEIFKRFRNDLVITKNFELTAEAYNPSNPSLQPTNFAALQFTWYRWPVKRSSNDGWQEISPSAKIRTCRSKKQWS